MIGLEDGKRGGVKNNPIFILIQSKNEQKVEREEIGEPFPTTQYLKAFAKIFMSKEERKPKENESDLSSESSGRDKDDDSEEKDSFIVSDDEEDDYSGSYGARRRYSDDDEYESKADKKKKKKKDKKKKDKKKKKKKRYDDDEDYDDNDLALIDENEQNNYRRLKKKKVERPVDEDQDYDLEDDLEPEEEDAEEGNFREYQGGYGSEQEYSRPNQIVEKIDEADLKQLFDQKVLKQFYEEEKDKEIVDLDLPERQILRYKPYAKMQNIQINDIKEKFEEEDRKTEAKWIFDKLKQQNHSNFENFEEKDCLKKIENVLNALNKEHLEIMYIYYYRKKLWADELNLNLLMKIAEIDEEWISFKKDYQELKKDFEEVIPSFIEVPRSLEEAFNSCTDTRVLKYFKDYTHFVLTKHRQPEESKSNSKSVNITRQMVGCGLLQEIEKMNVFLPPQYLCLNFRNRIQEKKPKTPHIQPDKAFRRSLREKFLANADQNKRYSSREEEQEDEERKDYQYDWSSMPLIAPDKRIRTVCTYLSLELFNYPELRKLLKEKYYKKLVVSTTPTVKGQQNINLYSSYFPVKRIKEKPVSNLAKQVWIMAVEAEKMGLITIELKFEWELSAHDKKNLQSDTVYLELVKYYFDVSSHESGEVWNVFRKQVLIKMLTDYFIPAFMEEVKEDLTRDGHKKIIELCCQKFKSQLNKGPSLKEGKPIKILAMVLEKDKLGMAFVDEQGIDHFPLCMQIFTDEDLKRFASESVLDKYIGTHQPDMILISANCRRAQTLRKELRNPSLFPEPIYCAFGEYQVPNLMANKKKMQGITTEKTILQAISMARMKKNPMAEILGLWSDSIEENGVLSMNLHPLQRCVNKRKLLDALEKVSIEIVNQVGLDVNELIEAEHCRNQLQFISGLGPRKAYDLLNRIKNQTGMHSKIHFRKDIMNLCGDIVYRNCSPFLKIITPEHIQLVERYDRERRKSTEQGIKLDETLMGEINLLDMTRIPEEWYQITEKLFVQAIQMQNMVELKSKKSIRNLPQSTLATLEMFKRPEKLRNVEWENRKDTNSPSMQYYDENLIKLEIMHRFKDIRDPEKVMENRDIFYSLLRETPETLRKYMVVTAKILSVHNQALNVVIQENGLFGNIKIYENKPQYEKGNFIKAIITGFPFDEGRKNNRFEDDQELLKVEMSLSFPHKTDDRNHDCMGICFPSIVKEMHPLIDLDKDNFDLRKQDKPVIEVKEEVVARPRNQTRRISHAKFKNIAMATAIDEVRNMPVGEFLFRPSTEGADFLTITWHFYKNIITHIKLRSEQKNISNTNCVYRILDKDRDKTFNTIDQVIDKHIKPMNALVQDVISNKKFMPNPVEQIEEKIRIDVSRDSSYIHYYFGCSPDYPQFFILIYIYKEKRPVKELIRVRSSGLYFHENMFQSLRELITWFKEHLKERQYQKYARNTAIKK